MRRFILAWLVAVCLLGTGVWPVRAESESTTAFVTGTARIEHDGGQSYPFVHYLMTGDQPNVTTWHGPAADGLPWIRVTADGTWYGTHRPFAFTASQCLSHSERGSTTAPATCVLTLDGIASGFCGFTSGYGTGSYYDSLGTSASFYWLLSTVGGVSQITGYIGDYDEPSGSVRMVFTFTPRDYEYQYGSCFAHSPYSQRFFDLAGGLLVRLG